MARFLGLRGVRLTSAISAVCGLCFLCYGYAQGVMGGLLTVPAFLERFPQVDVVNSSSSRNAWVTGLTVGSWNLACILSAVLAIFISDSLGRRRTLLLGITLWTIGEIIQTSSYSFAQFIVGRAIAGFGNGFTTSTAPAYQAECVKSHRKGTVLMISAGAFVTLGYALSYWSVFGFAYVNNTHAAWRIPIALQIAFALPAIALLFFLPDSPRWLILTGREQEALTVIAALNDEEPEDFETKDEFLQIKDAILVMAQGKASKLFSNKDRRGLHRVALAFLVQVFQQGTGINLVLQYLSWILLTHMGYSGWLARLLASCSATTYFLSSLVTVVGIDRFWGRRSLMMFGATGMSGSMILLTITQYLWTSQGISAARVAGTLFLFAFSIFFAIGWQGMAWLYQVEIVPLPIRGPANAISTLANWIINSLIVIITPIAFTNIGYRTWIIFAATNFAMIPLIYFFYPETAFRSLEEVDVIFFLADEAPGNPWLNAVKISMHEPLWFGRKGENRIGFDYANSSWHRKLMDTSNGSGSGSGSNNEKRGRKGPRASPGSRGQRNTNSSGSDTTIPQQIFEKRPGSESPVDPLMFSRNPNSLEHDTDHSPTTTLTTTSSLQKKDSRRSDRRERHTVANTPPNTTSARLSPEADPEWWDTHFVPASQRISCPSSEEHSAYNSDSTRHHVLHHPDYIAPLDHQRVGERPRTANNVASNFSYPGRLTRTESSVEDEDEARQGMGSRRSSGRMPRDSGRAY